MRRRAGYGQASVVKTPDTVRQTFVAPLVGEIRKEAMHPVRCRPQGPQRVPRRTRGVVAPLLIRAELCPTPDVDVRRHSLEIGEKTTLFRSRIEFDESNIGLEELVAVLRAEKTLGKEA